MLDDHTNLLSTWDSKSDDCCAWEGISYSNLTGHVEMLDLNSHQFGSFPDEINASLMELRHLKYLNPVGIRFQTVLSQIFFVLLEVKITWNPSAIK